VVFTIEDTGNLTQGLFPIFRITSVASVAEGSQTTIHAHISRIPYPTFPAQYINPGGNIAGNVVITGDFVLNGEDYNKITGNVTIDGTLVIFGDLTMQGGSLSVESIIVFGDVVMQGNSDISGNLCATGSISLSGSASISGVVTTGCSMDLFAYGILHYEVV
jgi:cytoskeletal protein CcmA (bactofilin family)